MEAKKPTSEELKELREEVLETKPTAQNTLKKLIFDKRQYSLRFPKKYIEEADIDINKDEFEIILILPDPSKADGEKPQLSATLMRK